MAERATADDAETRRTGVDSVGRTALQTELSALARGERAAFDPLFRRLWPTP